MQQLSLMTGPEARDEEISLIHPRFTPSTVRFAKIIEMRIIQVAAADIATMQ